MGWGIEAIGIIAGCLVYGAAAVKKLVVIKALLLAGALGFLAYGIILALPAIMIVNSVGTCFAIYGLVSAITNFSLLDFWRKIRKKGNKGKV